MKQFLFRLSLVVLALVSMVAIYFWAVKGFRYYSVQSDSMQPTLKVGDLVVDQKIELQNLKPNDIISYVSPTDSRIITHRLINLRQTKLITQGDNLATTDDPINSSQVIGKAKFKVPYLGYVMDSLRNPIGLIAIVYIPVVTIALVEFRRLSRTRTYKHANIS